VKKKGKKKRGNLIFWGKSLGRLKKKKNIEAVGKWSELEDLANSNVELSTWECRPDNFNLRIGLCQLCILPMWSWQRGKVNLTNYPSIWYPMLLMFNPVCSHQAPNDALSVFPKFPCVPQAVLNIMTVYPIFITQNSRFVTHIVRSKEKPPQSFILGVCIVWVFLCFFSVVGESKRLIAPKKERTTFNALWMLPTTSSFSLLVAYLCLRWPKNSK